MYKDTIRDFIILFINETIQSQYVYSDGCVHVIIIPLILVMCENSACEG